MQLIQKEIIKKQKIDHNLLKDNVLNFLNKLKVDDTVFSMSKTANNSIYSSIFALYIYYLLGETRRWDDEIKKKWINYINSFQDIESGLYSQYNTENFHSKPIYQLTTFALSALSILDGVPKHKLRFIEKWITKEAISKYLTDTGCWKGSPSSGNMAMFLGIFLSTPFGNDILNDNKRGELIDYWFYLHDQNQNHITGYWDNYGKYNAYYNLQNGFHQFEIYNYWNHNVNNYKRIVDSILSIQAFDGSFSPTLGGSACFDYDAVNSLINLGYRNDYRTTDINIALKRSLFKLTTLQNSDGGFCENNIHPSHLTNLLSVDTFRHIFFSNNIDIFLTRFKFTAKAFIKKEFTQKTHFADSPIPWNESDLWSTWFRLQTILEISTIIDTNSINNWHFHKHIGLGWF